EELEVDGAGRGRGVRLGVPDRVDLHPFLVVELVHEGYVHDLDRELPWRVERQIAVEPQIDDARDAVLQERGPAGVAQRPHGVGPDDRAEARRAPVLGRVAAEVADVDAPVPGEGPALRLQRARSGAHGVWS